MKFAGREGPNRRGGQHDEVETRATNSASRPKEMQERLRMLYRTLLEERQDSEARLLAEEANVKRHGEISRQLEELKRPHWSIIPNFWLTAGIFILTLLALIVALIALCRQR